MLLLKVWIGLVLSIFVCIRCIKLLEFLHRNIFPRSKNLKTMSETSMYVFASITNHGKQTISLNLGQRS